MGTGERREGEEIGIITPMDGTKNAEIIAGRIVPQGQLESAAVVASQKVVSGIR